MERYSEKVAAAVRGLKFEQIPADVRGKAKLVFLDALGIALASSTMDFGRIALDAARALGGNHESRLIGTPDKVAAANAVLANGTLAHGLDYDDTLEEAIVHTGCAGAMTALAVGEAVGAGGKQVLEAAIAGIEVMCKIGLVAPGKFHARGFHPTALCATFAAAAAAGKLYGLGERGERSMKAKLPLLVKLFQTIAELGSEHPRESAHGKEITPARALPLLSVEG